jgi:hypothetical protein
MKEFGILAFAQYGARGGRLSGSGNSINSLAISFIRWLLECALLRSELPMLNK